MSLVCDSSHESATNLVQIYDSCHCEAIQRIAEATQKNKINPHEVRILAKVFVTFCFRKK